MFNSLQDKLESAFKNLKGQARITDINIAATVKDIRRALVDADVNYKIAKEFTDKIKDKALGEKVINAISPGQLMVKMVKDIRRALVDADVNYKIAKEFTDKIKDKALGEKVINAISPGQLMVKIVKDELTELMGGSESDLDLAGSPAIILVAGLQG